MKTQLFANQSSAKVKPFRVTIFGAESTGKTTLSKDLADKLGTTWLYEFARPYLELTGVPVTRRSMTAIWHGQQVLQSMAEGELIVQDTDLYSTIGYWQFPHLHDHLGECPQKLIEAARTLRSDLYIITPSTIPFEADPLRYGGDHREGSDEYWESICKQYHLPYVVMQSVSRNDRLNEAHHIINHYTKRRLPCVA